ncbi:MAG: hypothetical protein R3E87_22345 [Burkholderiaceae bacterium]
MTTHSEDDEQDRHHDLSERQNAELDAWLRRLRDGQSDTPDADDARALDALALMMLADEAESRAAVARWLADADGRPTPSAEALSDEFARLVSGAGPSTSAAPASIAPASAAPVSIAGASIAGASIAGASAAPGSAASTSSAPAPIAPASSAPASMAAAAAASGAVAADHATSARATAGAAARAAAPDTPGPAGRSRRLAPPRSGSLLPNRFKWPLRGGVGLALASLLIWFAFHQGWLRDTPDEAVIAGQSREAQDATAVAQITIDSTSAPTAASTAVPIDWPCTAGQRALADAVDFAVRDWSNRQGIAMTPPAREAVVRSMCQAVATLIANAPRMSPNSVSADIEAVIDRYLAPATKDGGGMRGPSLLTLLQREHLQTALTSSRPIVLARLRIDIDAGARDLSLRIGDRTLPFATRLLLPASSTPVEVAVVDTGGGTRCETKLTPEAGSDHVLVCR